MVCGLKLIIPNTDHHVTCVILISFFISTVKKTAQGQNSKTKHKVGRLITAPLKPNRNTRGQKKKIWGRPKLLPLLHKKSHLSSFFLAFSVSLYTVFFFHMLHTLLHTRKRLQEISFLAPPQNSTVYSIISVDTRLMNNEGKNSIIFLLTATETAQGIKKGKQQCTEDNKSPLIYEKIKKERQWS